MSVWKDVISERDLQVYGAAGYGKPIGLTNLGRRPAVLVIDVTINFVGDKPEPILQSIKRYPNSCGEKGWDSVYKIRDLLEVARRKRVPVIYSKAEDSKDTSWAMKKSRFSGSDGNMIPREIQPQPGDIVISKRKPSVFFGTPLMSHLNYLDVDTLIATGCTTSGCVRATVLDAFSYNFKVVLVEECVFDRGEVSHKVNLFDMHQKYADVASTGQVMKYLSGLAPRQV